jgi:hypothetical protein
VELLFQRRYSQGTAANGDVMVCIAWDLCLEAEGRWCILPEGCRQMVLDEDGGIVCKTH